MQLARTLCSSCHLRRGGCEAIDEVIRCHGQLIEGDSPALVVQVISFAPSVEAALSAPLLVLGFSIFPYSMFLGYFMLYLCQNWACLRLKFAAAELLCSGALGVRVKDEAQRVLDGTVDFGGRCARSMWDGLCSALQVTVPFPGRRFYALYTLPTLLSDGTGLLSLGSVFAYDMIAGS